MLSLCVITTFATNLFVAGYTGLSFETFKENLWVDYQPTGGKDMDFFKVFIVVFPAMTGTFHE